MERSLSEDHIAFGPETPWETDKFDRRTHSNDTAPPVPGVKKSIAPGLRRTMSAAPKPTVTRNSMHRSEEFPRHHTPPSDLGSRQRRARESMSPHTSPRPYETPVFFPKENEPAFREPYFGKPPVTPPTSISSPSTFESDNSPTDQAVNAFPGTMAARNAQVRTSARQRAAAAKRKKSPSKTQHHWRSAFKGMFRRVTVDKTQLERIQGRHWADE